MIVAKNCCILHNMTVGERNGGFVGNGIGGIRLNDMESDETLNLMPIDTGMLRLRNMDSDSIWSAEEHYNLKNALVNHIWNENWLE